ncbi:MAG TPA: CoA-binding protein [Chloroflexi bacterium]|nr:CoA-binding protein [Chloroflexota bacterium]HAL26708.1 CoA-binding protein [Chloroflexota bacterium]
MTSPVRYQDPRVILATLRSARTVAIVGLSKDPLRPSNFIGFYLKRHGYTIVPVNPRETEILGERAYPSLTAIPFLVDVVDVFRRPDAVPDIARDAVASGAKALWLQFGVISPDGAKIAEDAGLDVVMDRCMKVEHARHLGRMHWLGFNTGRITAVRERGLG